MLLCHIPEDDMSKSVVGPRCPEKRSAELVRVTSISYRRGLDRFPMNQSGYAYIQELCEDLTKSEDDQLRLRLHPIEWPKRSQNWNPET